MLVLPGLGGSGPGHWQTLWEAEDPALRRVAQREWDRPVLRDWVDTLARAIAECPAPPVLVAHSLGCALVAHWARDGGRAVDGAVEGALLVSPPDVDSERHTPPETRAFAPMPVVRLPFRSVVVASTNDPYADADRAALFARAWGSRLVLVGDAGHVNAESGLGRWPAGRALLEEF